MRYVALLLLITCSMGCISTRKAVVNERPEIGSDGKATGTVLRDKTTTTYHASLIEGFETVANADALLSCADTIKNMRAAEQDPYVGDSITCTQGRLHRDTNGMWGYTYPNGGYMMLTPRQLQYFGLRNGYNNMNGGPQLGPTSDATMSLPENGGTPLMVFGRKRKIYTYPTGRHASKESLAPAPLAVRGSVSGGTTTVTGGGSNTAPVVEAEVKLTKEEQDVVNAYALCVPSDPADQRIINTPACQTARVNMKALEVRLRNSYLATQAIEAAKRGEGGPLAMNGGGTPPVIGSQPANGFATGAVEKKP